MKQPSIEMQRVVNAPVSKVWSALTNPDEMKNWYFPISDFKAEVGFQFEFMGGSKEKQYRHLCEITEVVPERKLAYTWKYDGYPGDSLVSFELEPQGDKTLVTLKHDGIETLGDGGKDFQPESFMKGWTYILNTGLAGYVERIGG